jgi:hypothetical protein
MQENISLGSGGLPGTLTGGPLHLGNTFAAQVTAVPAAWGGDMIPHPSAGAPTILISQRHKIIGNERPTR